jgi:DeoD family purine-nucleoside phosphorylase
MPIHVRAEPGDYAEACLLPGDPARAKLIAETFLDGAVERNVERGLVGYTGTFEGKPVSVQATGMGSPSVAIVVEELAQLGVRRLLRVGTCGGLRPELALGDLVLALTAVPRDGTTSTYVPEPHCPTADWELLHGLVHAAKELGEQPHVGPIVSSDVFYNPVPEQYAHWAARGILAVEMEAAILFTLGALRGLQTGCVLVVSDDLTRSRPERIPDDELRAAVERMTLLALRAVTADPKH